MKLKRQVIGDQVIFKNAETDEIVKTETVHETSTIPTAIPYHTSVLSLIITIIGVVTLLISIILIITGARSEFLGIATIPIGVGLFISAILFFALAEIVYYVQYQTKLLKKLLEKQL